MLIDSHIHLDHTDFDADRAAVLRRAQAVGVMQLVIPGVDAASWPRIHALCAQQPPARFPAWGLHPLFLARHGTDDLAALRHWCIAHPPVAIGEIGLDFHDPTLDPAHQRELFAAQLRLAAELDLPVIVHARQALEEVILTLRRHAGLRGVVHSFSGSPEQAQRLWQLGFHLGIGGTITYARAQRLRRIVASMPIEHLLLESDAPDQPDADWRGRRNEPARVAAVRDAVAALRGEAPAAVAAATSANARQLFRLPATP